MMNLLFLITKFHNSINFSQLSADLKWKQQQTKARGARETSTKQNQKKPCCQPDLANEGRLDAVHRGSGGSQSMNHDFLKKMFEVSGLP